MTPPKKDTPAQGAFTFGTATMKMMAVVYRLIVPVAFIFVALLSIGDWWQLPVAIGLALIALLERFDEFNRNLPSALGSLAVRSAGFVVDMLSDPRRDHPRLINALRRFAPHLMPPEP